MNASARRDPISKPPLRDPGQSIRELLDKQFDEVFVPWLMVAVLTGVMAVLEWIRWYTSAPYVPLGISAVAVTVGILAVWRIRRAFREAKRLKQGLKGERYIGQFLQAELLPRNYFVIHDICVGDANVDHAIIGPRGIFAVEVKTQRKPDRGETRIAYDGKRVLINGQPPERIPLIQARAEAKNIREILEEQTGRKVPVRPVVLYPQWFVEEPPGVDVWVLNETRFLGFIEQESIKFTDEQVRELANGLMRYVRAQLES